MVVIFDSSCHLPVLPVYRYYFCFDFVFAAVVSFDDGFGFVYALAWLSAVVLVTVVAQAE